MSGLPTLQEDEMPGKAKAIPEGFHAVTPHLVTRDAAKAIEFYNWAFGAELQGKSHDSPDGKITHATLKIGDSLLMLADEFPSFGSLSPESLGGSPVVIHLYVEDVDAVFNRAVSAGATSTMPLMDAFWGDRYGQLTDPFGHRWSLATHKENLTDEEVGQRGKAFFENFGKKAHHGS
jgi:PhnB protein